MNDQKAGYPFNRPTEKSERSIPHRQEFKPVPPKQVITKPPEVKLPAPEAKQRAMMLKEVTPSQVLQMSGTNEYKLYTDLNTEEVLHLKGIVGDQPFKGPGYLFRESLRKRGGTKL